ncbi:MAG: TIM barrel protein [Dehalococcoidales bacterium]|nr:TIM barrel protein [Dehalococcoidales bacterium]
MAGLLFGTAGIPHSTRLQSAVCGIERSAELGLGCMEMEFVRGVKMGEATAWQVADTAAKAGIRLSAHAPYFINLNARELAKIKASQQRLLATARIAALCGAESIVFHTAFYLGNPPRDVYQTVKKYLKETLDQLKSENNRVLIRPEVMGRVAQFGTVDEIIELSSELEGLAPCLDFAHWHARTGESNSYPEFCAILDKVKERLGQTALGSMHIHISGIAYGKKGELNHLNLKEADLDYVALLRAFKDYDIKGLVICESPNLEADALLLQETYSRLLRTG